VGRDRIGREIAQEDATEDGEEGSHEGRAKQDCTRGRAEEERAEDTDSRQED